MLSSLLRRKDLSAPTTPAGVPSPVALTIRLAVPADEPALADLASLDSSRPPRGLVLVAEVRGELWAALSLDDGHAVADPTRPSGELSWLLLERGRRLRRAERGRLADLGRVWPRTLETAHAG
jgi:hypothetical protein